MGPRVVGADARVEESVLAEGAKGAGRRKTLIAIFQRGAVDGRLEVERNFAQRRNAPVETETSGFTLVNAAVNWRPLESRPHLTLGLAANNLFDVNARRHTSLLKDYAPLAGRDFRLSLRATF